MTSTDLLPNYNTLTQAVAFGTLKRAALFFPRVFPALAPPELWTLRGSDLQMDHRFVRIMASLLARPGQEPAKDAAEWMLHWWMPVASCASRMEAAETTALEDECVAGLVHAMLYKHVTDIETIEGERTTYRAHLIAMLKKLGLESPSLVLPEAVVQRTDSSPVSAAQYYFGEESSAPPAEPARTLMLSLSDLGLANADSADWEQILEIRRDEAAMEQLRNLRLFLHEHYAGKEKAYISDDLARRMAQHQGAARKHGLQLATGTITALMEPSSLVGLGIAALAGSAIGGATVGLSTAVVGAGLHAAKTGLNMLGEAQERQLFLEQHELAYVFQLRTLQP